MFWRLLLGECIVRRSQNFHISTTCMERYFDLNKPTPIVA